MLAATTGLWIGGLTFYAAVVGPIGSHVVGRMDQGRITQHVTNWLNLFGVLAIVALGLNACRERKPSIVVTWLGIALLQVSLLCLHPILDHHLAAVPVSSESSGPLFYEWHRAYLIITTVMWVLALDHIWLLTAPNRVQGSTDTNNT